MKSTDESRSLHQKYVFLRVVAKGCKNHENLMIVSVYIGCSERRLIGHSFYRQNLLRKSCATYREKFRRAAPRTEKSDMPAQ
jgi:hypothetical protein